MLGGIVRGQRTTLRVPTIADLTDVDRWMADMRVRRAGQIWAEPAMTATWKERLAEAAKDEHTVLWTIEADGQPIGTARVGFERERPVNWIQHLVIDPALWRRGYGFDAALALHRYLFDYLERIGCQLEVAADNVAALRIVERLGYREFGRGHEVYYRDAHYTDDVWLRFDRSTWLERWSSEREYQALPEGINR